MKEIDQMTKIVIAKSHAGFGLSDEAMEAYLVTKGIPFDKGTDEYVYGDQRRFEFSIKDTDDLIWDDEIPRDDLDLVRIVEELGKKAWLDTFAELRVIEIPDDVNWQIKEYDSVEWIAEVHRTWS